MRKRRKFMIAGLAVVLLLALVPFLGFHGGKKTQPEISKRAPLVHVQRVRRADMMRHVILSGQTVAEATVDLAPRYTGRIVAVNAELGDKVRAGDVLLVQDMEDLDISILQNTAAAKAAAEEASLAEVSYAANYIMAENAFSLERSKYERNQYLYSIGAISRDTLDSVEKEYMAKKAAFDVLENQAADGSPASVEAKRYAAEQQSIATEALRKQREDLILRAPRDGIISYRNAEAGAMVTAGAKVFSLVDIRHLYVDCNLSEKDVVVLKSGQSLSMAIDAIGSDCEGEIIYVSPAMDESSKTYLVRILLQVPENAARAGLFARGWMDVLQRSHTIFVPKSAVIDRDGHTAVILVREDGTAEEREVRIGLANDTDVELLSGVEEGEVVILDNQDKLKDGDALEMAEDAA